MTASKALRRGNCCIELLLPSASAMDIPPPWCCCDNSVSLVAGPRCAAVLQVQQSIADVLLRSGVATSRYAGRLFRPSAPAAAVPPAAKAVAQPVETVIAAPASSSSGSLRNAAGAAVGTPTEASGTPTAAASASDTEAAAEAALAAADSLIQQLSAMGLQDEAAVGIDAFVDAGVSRPQGGEQPQFEPLPLVMHEAHTEDE